jgi:hypothetical protein
VKSKRLEGYEPVDKFKANTAGVLSEEQVEELLKTCWELDKYDTLDGYAQLLVGDV